MLRVEQKDIRQSHSKRQKNFTKIGLKRRWFLVGFAYLYPFKEKERIACYTGFWRRWKKVIALNYKARKLETFKPGNKYVRNGIGKVERALTCGCRDQRTSCDAFQTLLYVCDT